MERCSIGASKLKVVDRSSLYRIMKFIRDAWLVSLSPDKIMSYPRQSSRLQLESRRVSVSSTLKKDTSLRSFTIRFISGRWTSRF